MKVKVFKTKKDNGYDLEVLDPLATIKDYLDSMNDFIDRNTDPPCRGCDECCWERIPLTSIDVINYLNALGNNLHLDKDWPLLDFLKKYAYVYIEGGAVDISLGFTMEGACSFLNQEEHICSSYLVRSLVCQTFVCMESSPRAQELRSQLVNLGMDELVRLFLIQTKESGRKLFAHEAYEATPSLNDYPRNGFTGKVSYADIYLKDVCTKQTWDKLLKI